MKKAGVFLIIAVMLITMFPQSASAAKTADFTKELKQYLTEVSTERGYEVTKEDIEAVLSSYSDSLNNYKTIKDLKEFLGEVIKADYSNLTYVYETYELDQDSLNLLLQDNGEELTDYIYLNDLIFAVYFYQDSKPVVKDPDFDQKLDEYLTQVSQVRGFEVTKDRLEATLMNYDSTLEDFGTVDEIIEYLGEVIKADLSSLDYFKKTYNLDLDALFQVLGENGKSIDDYVYIDDLEQFIWANYDGELPDFEDILGDLEEIFNQIGLTDKEIQNLINYFSSMEEYYSDPALENQILAISNPFMALFETITPGEDLLTNKQIKDLTSIYKDILTLLKLDAVLKVDTNGSKTLVSMEELLMALNKQELKGSLIIELYGDGKLLADMVIDSDMFGPVGEVIEDTAGEVTGKTPDTPKSTGKEIKTVKGGKLPKTASSNLPKAILGLIITGAGFALYRKGRISRHESKNEA